MFLEGADDARRGTREVDEGMAAAHVGRGVGNLHVGTARGALAPHPLGSEAELKAALPHLQTALGDELRQGHLGFALGALRHLRFQSGSGGYHDFVVTMRTFQKDVHRASDFVHQISYIVMSASFE